jgi:hypothetical protein
MEVAGAAAIASVTKVLSFAGKRFRIAMLQLNVTAGADIAQGLALIKRTGMSDITISTPFVQGGAAATMAGAIGYPFGVAGQTQVVGTQIGAFPDGCAAPFPLPDIWFESEMTLQVTTAGPGATTIAKVGIWLQFED